MVLKFIKTNWFVIALAAIVVLGVARKKLPFLTNSPSRPEKIEQTGGKKEKYTGKESAAAADQKNLSGILIGGERARVEMSEVEVAQAMIFLKRFGTVTEGEQKKFNIPASALLACAYVNSFAGQRPCAQEANNYFALPCSMEWDGKMKTLHDHCYRQYATPWESFRDFSIYLSAQDWVAETRKRAGNDYKAWVKAFAQNGASDVRDAEALMLHVIEEYKLQNY